MCVLYYRLAASFYVVLKLFTLDLDSTLDTRLDRGSRVRVHQRGAIAVLMRLGPLGQLLVLPYRRPGLVPEVPQLLLELDLLPGFFIPFPLLKLGIEPLGPTPLLERKLLDLATQVEHHVVPSHLLGVGSLPEGEEFRVAEFGVGEEVVLAALGLGQEGVLVRVGVTAGDADRDVEVAEELEVDVDGAAVLAFVVVLCSQEDC